MLAEARASVTWRTSPWRQLTGTRANARPQYGSQNANWEAAIRSRPDSPLAQCLEAKSVERHAHRRPSRHGAVSIGTDTIVAAGQIDPDAILDGCRHSEFDASTHTLRARRVIADRYPEPTDEVSPAKFQIACKPTRGMKTASPNSKR